MPTKSLPAGVVSVAASTRLAACDGMNHQDFVLLEIWFNRITQRAIRRGTLRSVKELVEKIDQYVRTSNTHAHPFTWTATADSIFAKVQRLCERISGTGH
jgi:hypothetical protein